MTQDPKARTSPSGTPSKSKSTAQPRSKIRALLQLIGQLGEIVLAFVPLLVKGIVQLGKVLLQGLKWLWQWWQATLPKLRRVLPSWNAQLPDWLFTSIAIGLLVLLIGVPVVLQTHRATAANQAIEQPSTAAKKNEPNAARLMAIQNQLTEVADRYAEDLLQAVQIRFAQKDLTIAMNDSWQTLPSDQQEQLANDLLQRSRKLSFNSLEIRDVNGRTIARNPVIGSKMVLFTATDSTVAS